MSQNSLGTPAGRVPWVWNKIVHDSCRNVALYLTSVVHQQQQKFVFKLLTGPNIFSDVADTNRICYRLIDNIA